MKAFHHHASTQKVFLRGSAQVTRPNQRSKLARVLLCGALSAGFLSVWGCRSPGDAQNQSGVKIVNGKEISPRDSGLAKSVFNLKVLNESLTTVENSCTAAAISENVVLVAAHCIPSSDNALKRLKIEGKTALASGIIGPKSLFEASLLSDEDAAVDVAAVVFDSPSPVFSAQEIAPLAQSSAGRGSSVKMIGFGATELEALKNPTEVDISGQAAVGSQTVILADGLIYELRADLKDLENPRSGIAIAAPGDSGAPLFNTSGQLTGLIVGLSYLSQGSAIDLGQDIEIVAAKADSADAYGNRAVDLKSPAAQKIIQIALGKIGGTFDYQPNSKSSRPLLAICGRKSNSGDTEGASSTGRDDARSRRNLRDLLRGRNLNDLINQLSNGGLIGTGTNTQGSSSSSLSPSDIQGLLNDL